MFYKNKYENITGFKLFIAFILILAIVLFLFSVINSFSYIKCVLLFISFVILVISATPLFLNNGSDYLTPWTYFFYFTFLDIYLRIFYIVNGIPNSDFINAMFLLDRGFETLLFPSVIVLVGYIFLLLGFLTNNQNIVNSKELNKNIKNNWNQNKLFAVVIVLLIVSLIALINFISLSIDNVLQLAFENMSAYRGTSTEISEYNAHGLLRWLILLSNVAVNLIYSNILVSTQNRKLSIFLLVVSFIISGFFFFFIQSRSGFLYLFINLFALRYYIKGSVPVYKIAILAVFGLYALGLITSLRAGSGYDLANFDIYAPLNGLQPLVADNTGIDISKTGLIIDHVKYNFEYGNTFLWIIISWIPRQLWPMKPVNIDTVVGIEVYGSNAFGAGAVPPGLFAELYWNFWYLGILIGCWLVGKYIYRIQKIFVLKGKFNLNGIIVYVLCFMQIGLGIVGSSIVSWVTVMLLTYIPLSLTLKYITINPDLIIKK